MHSAILNKLRKIKIRRLLTWVLFGTFVLLVGCGVSSWTKRWQQSADPYQGGDYPEVFSKWSREARIYHGLDLKLIVAGTVKSSQFRQAYADEYARVYQLSEKDRGKMLQDQINASDEYIDIVLAVYVPEKSWNDFAKKKSMWKLYLSGQDGRRFNPLEVREIKKSSGELNHFYPYISPWKSLYHARFPADAKNGRASIKLIITGVLGSAEMVWEDFY